MTVLYLVTRNCFPLFNLIYFGSRAYLSFLYLFVICVGEVHKGHRKCMCPVLLKVRPELKIYCAR